MDEDSIKVTYIKDKETQIEKDLSWPQEFDALIQDIREKFGFEDKNTKVNLKVVTYDEDDYTIESQQNLQRYIDNDDIKEFKFTIEIKKDDTKDFTDGKKDKEFEKLIDNLIKEEEEKEQDLDIDEMIKDVFGNENYEEKLKKERDKLADSFNQTFEKKVGDLMTQKSKMMQEKISRQLSTFSNLFLDQQKDVKNLFADMRANLAEIKDQTEEMSTGINELFESIQRNELILSKVINPNPNPFDDIVGQKIEEKLKEQAAQIYEELKNEFHDYENLIEKNDIIDQLLKNNFNKEEIKKSLNLKIEKIKQEEKEKENKNKIEEILNQLNFHDDNEFKMDEIRALIKQNDFNKENVQNWINEQLCQKIYNELKKSPDVDITKASEDEVFQKIIKLNFKIDEIKILYPKKKEKVVNPVVRPADNENAGAAKNEDDEEVDKIYNELEDDYGISGYIEEELAKIKIRELKLDRDAIIEWIENSLVSGNN